MQHRQRAIPLTIIAVISTAILLLLTMFIAKSMETHARQALAPAQQTTNLVDLYGTVWLNGRAITGAEVTITAEDGSQAVVRTRLDSGNDQPTYDMTLSGPPLSLEEGHDIQITARYADRAHTVDYRTLPGEQRVDIVLASTSVDENYVFENSFWHQADRGRLNGPHGIAINSKRHLYVMDRQNQRLQVFDQGGNVLDEWGKLGNGEGEFFGPFGIAIDRDDNVYVADTGNHRIQKFTAQGAFLAEWGSFGSALGQFNRPEGVVVDSDGFIYVADSGNHRIQKFDPERNALVIAFGTQGSDKGVFRTPTALAIDSQDNLYVTDYQNHRVQKFDSQGRFLLTLDSEDFDLPDGIAVDGDDNVYVSDTNHRIQKFNSEGKWLDAFGHQGMGERQFIYPKGLAVDRDDNLYVADESNDRVQKFDPAFTWMATWGEAGDNLQQLAAPGGMAVDDQGRLYIADGEESRIQLFDSDGQWLRNIDEGLDQPQDVAIDQEGNLYVAERSFHRIQKLDPDGNPLLSWGGRGRENGEFNEPTAVAFDENGNIYVVDKYNHRIQKFDPNGNHLATWGSSLGGSTAVGKFNAPGDIAIGPGGTVYVADTANHRIQIFTANGEYLQTLGSFGGNDGQFDRVSGIEVDGAGNLYAVDRTTRIQKFNAQGDHLATWGAGPIQVGNSGIAIPTVNQLTCYQIDCRLRLAVGADGSVYVTDPENNRVQHFRSQPADRPPIAWINWAEAVNLTTADTLHLHALAQDDDATNTIESYEWISDRDGLLGEYRGLHFSDRDLTAGRHTISVRALDDEGHWSEFDSIIIDIVAPMPTGTPTATSTSEPTWTPTNTLTSEPTWTPTNTPTYAPMQTPTNTPLHASTWTPTNTPTSEPTWTPTNIPTSEPTWTPTHMPTYAPMQTPTNTPLDGPTWTPTHTPTSQPTLTSTPTSTPAAILTLTGTSTSTGTGNPTPSPTTTSTPGGSLNDDIPRLSDHCHEISIASNSEPADCLVGIVYINGHPAEGIEVQIQNDFGEAKTVRTRQRRGREARPYYHFNFSDLYISTNNFFTVTVEYNDNSHSVRYGAYPGQQQIDIVIPSDDQLGPIATIRNLSDDVIGPHEKLLVDGMGQPGITGSSIDSYRWSSDRQGLLGEAASLELPPGGLYPGRHTLALEVIDNQDNVSRSTVADIYVTGTWTLLFYLGADSHGNENLYQRFQDMLDNMADQMSESIQIVAQIDGPDDGDTERWLIQGGVEGLFVRKTRCGGSHCEMEMDQPDTLADFLRWAQGMAPANQYYLVIADQGQGIQGIAWDATSDQADDGILNDSAYLTIRELEEALSSPGVEGVDILHLDASSINLLETTYELRHRIDVLISSQYRAWDYFAYADYLSVFEDSHLPLDEIAKEIMLDYKKSADEDTHPYTISGLDMRYASNIFSGVNQISKRLLELMDDGTLDKETLARVRADVQTFDSDGNQVNDINDYYIDLLDWSALLTSEINSQALERQIAAWELNLLKFIIDDYSASYALPSHHGGQEIDLDRANGVSIFYPLHQGTTAFAEYVEHELFVFTTASSWPNFLQEVVPANVQRRMLLDPLPGPLGHLEAMFADANTATPTPTSTAAPTPSSTEISTPAITSKVTATPTATFTPRNTRTATHTPMLTPTMTDTVRPTPANGEQIYLPIIKT